MSIAGKLSSTTPNDFKPVSLLILTENFLDTYTSIDKGENQNRR